jgi:hypothetical protein
MIFVITYIKMRKCNLSEKFYITVHIKKNSIYRMNFSIMYIAKIQYIGWMLFYTLRFWDTVIILRLFDTLVCQTPSCRCIVPKNIHGFKNSFKEMLNCSCPLNNFRFCYTVYNSPKFKGFINCTLWSIIVVITLGKCAHRTPSGVRERHKCIGLI